MAVVQFSNAAQLQESIWNELQIEARAFAKQEKALASFLYGTIINQESFCRALGTYMADKLATPEFSALHLRQMIMNICRNNPDIIQGAALDLQAVRERDPACKSYVQAFLYFKGYMALQIHRIAYYLWQEGRELMAWHLQSRTSELFGVDIHPAAQFGTGIMLDHASSLVAGETSAVGDNCSILHGVTLGGTGKEHQDRHPKIGKNVLIGAGAKILGNIKIGDGARIAAGSVVLKDVPAGCTVAGVPAKAIGKCCENPADEMDQIL